MIMAWRTPRVGGGAVGSSLRTAPTLGTPRTRAEGSELKSVPARGLERKRGREGAGRSVGRGVELVEGDDEQFLAELMPLSLGCTCNLPLSQYIHRLVVSDHGFKFNLMLVAAAPPPRSGMAHVSHQVNASMSALRSRHPRKVGAGWQGEGKGKGKGGVLTVRRELEMN